MPEENGCGEGCRTYMNDIIGKAIISIIIIALILGTIIGMVSYYGSPEDESNNENNLSQNESEKMVNYEEILQGTDTENIKLPSLNISGPLINKNIIKLSDLDTINESIKIKNPGDNPVDLTGWKITDSDGLHVFTFPEFIIQPGKSVTIYSNSNQDNNTDKDNLMIWSEKNVWDDEGDIAKIYDENKNLIDIEKSL
ncbi:lamin tail domain-containing protein [Methanoplanus sp. FWC-SCC4]|uniref:Lamin tail domain-containing protein n=1 Tax=Methanochimaera problematica TaxID=2609417 RepID=A0AA97FCE2_9EURY|nr:lamin tail domain-containing protein [Methanoplanus sp. FWC-SCC4]WOF15932.1 lamin tail domain-containing protein [Methanoplanus sp. FWC-SCC4]